MQGLVPQRAVPSPHTEYLGITYCEGSNADRSSALGLRLNQQDKNEEKQKTHPVISTMSRVIVPFAKCFQTGCETVTGDLTCFVFMAWNRGSLQLSAPRGLWGWLPGQLVLPPLCPQAEASL